MSTIHIDDITFKKLETNAASLGLSLPDYLRVVADSARKAAHADGGRNGSDLAALMAPILAEAKQVVPVPQPTRGDGAESVVEDAVVAKFRKQGFKL